MTLQTIEPITIRCARAKDVKAVLDLWEQARSLAASIPDDEPAIARLLDRDRDALLVAEDRGTIVGTLIAAWDGWRGNMYRLAVRPGHRRQGIARALVRSGEERLRERGAKRITALVASDDAAASVWRSAGYSLDEEVGRFVRNV